MMRRPSRQFDGRRRRAVRLVALAAALFGLVSLIFIAYSNESSAMPSAENATATLTQDYTRFPHDTPQHTRMPCLVCHVRNDNGAAMRYPGHIPCSSCHQEQFAQGNSHPMCYICHTPTSVKPFPGLKSFNAIFDHAQHSRQTTCATCHSPSRRGVALSIPARASGHTTCFQCHTPDSKSGDKNIATCSTCHQPGSPSRTSESAKAFQMNFSHAEHARKGLNCAQCHTVMAGRGRGRQVSAPVAAMHFARARVRTCASCHDNRRAFGGNDFSDCKRCHEGRSFGF